MTAAYTDASDRWNVDSFYRASRGPLNTSVARGSHFLQQDISVFDAAFFKLSQVEVAGIFIQAVFGSQTG